MDSNRVLVLDKGKLAEFDSPNKLLHDKTSIFYGMAKDAGLVNWKQTLQFATQFVFSKICDVVLVFIYNYCLFMYICNV